MEFIRRSLRKILGWNSPFYKFASRSLNRACILRTEGWATLRQLERLERATSSKVEETIEFSRLLHPFHLRPGMKDASVAIDNFVREEYAAILPTGQPKILVDGGAFIGDTTAYFLSKYRMMRSISFEPMPDSFNQARKNLAPYGDRVSLQNMALSADGQPVQMIGTQTGARIGETGDLDVQSRTIPQILADLPNHRIDILKLDIEGAEGPIFAQNPNAWLSHIGFIIVETHGPEITRTVLGALHEAKWRVTRVRNLYFCQPALRRLKSRT